MRTGSMLLQLGAAPSLWMPSESDPGHGRGLHGPDANANADAELASASRRLHRPFLAFAMLALHFLGILQARGDGIPEPDLILYGVVRDRSGGLDVRLTAGELVFTFQPSGGGAPLTVTTALQNMNDQFSYVLRVRCETESPGATASPAALRLGSSFDRRQVTVAGVAAGFVQESQKVLTLARTDRGRMERVDLVVSLGGTETLPDTWQLQYFGHLGVDPAKDADLDGVSNWGEYVAGTDPVDPNSLFEIRVSDEAAGGAKLEWASVMGRVYTLQRSTELLGGFTPLATGIPATPPTNVYRDPAAVGGKTQFFYRVIVGGN